MTMETVNGQVFNIPSVVKNKAEAQIAKSSLERYIENGRTRGATVLERLEAEIPKDLPISPKKVNWRVEGKSLQISDENTDGWIHLHANALQQAAERVSLPKRYIDRLLEDAGEAEAFGKRLVAYNLQELYKNVDFGESAFLRARTVTSLKTKQREVRSLMSASYRPLDSRPLFETFLLAAQKSQAMVVDGASSEIQLSMSVVVPQIHEIGDDYVVYGLRLRNSDHGRGPVALEPFMVRLRCLNGMVAESAYKQIHLGGSRNWEISQETYGKELEATRSAINDVVSKRLDDGFLRSMSELHARATATEVSPEKATMILNSSIKDALAAEERRRVLAMFEAEERDASVMPPGKNLWALANAVSYLANEPGRSPDSRMEIHNAAGKILSAGKA